MVCQKAAVRNLNGMHLRPASELCEEAEKFLSVITIKNGEKTANAKSLLSVLAAGIKCGDEIEIICDGKDEQEAMEAISGLIDSTFGK